MCLKLGQVVSPIWQVVSKRRKVVMDMALQMETELSAAIATAAWARLLAAAPHAKEIATSLLREWLRAVYTKPPEHYNDDTQLAAAVTGAEFAARCVKGWPGALLQLARLLYPTEEADVALGNQYKV